MQQENSEIGQPQHDEESKLRTAIMNILRIKRSAKYSDVTRAATEAYQHFAAFMSRAFQQIKFAVTEELPKQPTDAAWDEIDANLERTRYKLIHETIKHFYNYYNTLTHPKVNLFPTHYPSQPHKLVRGKMDNSDRILIKEFLLLTPDPPFFQHTDAKNSNYKAAMTRILWRMEPIKYPRRRTAVAGDIWRIMDTPVSFVQLPGMKYQRLELTNLNDDERDPDRNEQRVWETTGEIPFPQAPSNERVTISRVEPTTGLPTTRTNLFPNALPGPTPHAFYPGRHTAVPTAVPTAAPTALPTAVPIADPLFPYGNTLGPNLFETASDAGTEGTMATLYRHP